MWSSRSGDWNLASVDFGAILRPRAARDGAGRGEADRQRQRRGERRRDAEPVALDECEKDRREPEDEDQARQRQPHRGPAHRHERDHDNGKRNRRGRVDPAGRWRPRQSVAGHEIADCSREHFRARRNAIEWRRERVRRARGRNADDDDFAAERLRIEISAQDPRRADAPEASRGSVEAQRHVIAEVHCSRLACDLDPVGRQDRLSLEPLGGGGEREGWSHAVGSLKDHRNIARHAARVGRDVGEPCLRRVADRVDRPENGGRLRRERQIASLGLRRLSRVENSDRRDDSRRAFERAGQLRVRRLALRIEEGDIDGDRPRMELRHGPHDTRGHFARGGAASGFAQRLVVNRHDHDAWGRGTHAGEKEAPVEGEGFDPVQWRSNAIDLKRA